MQRDELGTIRHDLKNVVTALASGCMLLEARLSAAASEEVREILNEMRSELARGNEALARLKAIDTPSREATP